MTDERTDDNQPAEEKHETTLLEDLEASAKELEGTEDTPAETETSEKKGGEEGVESKETTTETATQAAPAAITAPEHWPADKREMFSKIPKEAQEFVLERHKGMEADYTKKTQEISEIRRRDQAVQQVFTPFRQQLASKGIDEVSLIKQYVAFDVALSQDPVGTLKKIAAERGIDLGNLDDESYGEKRQAGAGIDPQLLTRISQIESTLTNQQQSSIQSQIQGFANERDASGNPKRPHFEKVRGTMGAMMQVNPSLTMETAYEQAIWADPEVRKSIQESEQQKQQEQAREALKKQTDAERMKAVRAGKAATSTAPGKDSSSAPNETGSLADDLKETAKELGMRI